MQITLKTAPAETLRNSQVGDWLHNADGSMTILASNMNNPDYEFCVLIHELVESYICKRRGITDKQVTEFDAAYEEDRREGDTSENGDSIHAPYRREHFCATNVERIVAAELGIVWSEYENAIELLFAPVRFNSGPCHNI